jgi:1-deoxy-D-xylulose-5-phosphate reductoisomerase
MRTVAILGATGSVGRQALEIVRDHPDLRLAGLAAHGSHAEVVAAAREQGAAAIALADPASAERARSDFDGRVLGGQDGVVELVRELRADIVLNAIVGAAGLEATMAALDAGSDLALANK